MNNDLLRTLDDTEREKIMREELGEEKCKVIDKYGLSTNKKLYWERVQEKYPVQECFSHKFAKKSSTLGMVFHLYRLCFAKTKYFENNWEKFESCIYDCKRGFIVTPIYNMEFIRHKSTGVVIDLRELSKIHWLQDFKDLCKYIEDKENELFKMSVGM
ncbi:hypothetical protein [Clostridium senegalense]|uniref:hypothetical protein n=1 Tax=Clostridium senegalense TaxID=1465809 RepID=UPI0002884626|nr:hypothetical protein [Clostridium senegalense]